MLLPGCSSKIRANTPNNRPSAYLDISGLVLPTGVSPDVCFNPISIPDGVDRDRAMSGLGMACTMLRQFEEAEPDLIRPGCLGTVGVSFWPKTPDRAVGWTDSANNTIYLAPLETEEEIALVATHESAHIVWANCSPARTFPVNDMPVVEVSVGNTLPRTLPGPPNPEYNSDVCIEVDNPELLRSVLPDVDVKEGDTVCTNFGREFLADGMEILAAGLAPDSLEPGQEWLLPPYGYRLNLLYGQLRDLGLNQSPKEFVKMMEINNSSRVYSDFAERTSQAGVKDSNKAIQALVEHSLKYMHTTVESSLYQTEQVSGVVTFIIGIPSQGYPSVSVSAQPGEIVESWSLTYPDIRTNSVALCPGEVFWSISRSEDATQYWVSDTGKFEARQVLNDPNNPMTAADLCAIANKLPDPNVPD